MIIISSLMYLKTWFYFRENGDQIKIIMKDNSLRSDRVLNGIEKQNVEIFLKVNTLPEGKFLGWERNGFTYNFHKKEQK